MEWRLWDAVLFEFEWPVLSGDRSCALVDGVFERGVTGPGIVFRPLFTDSPDAYRALSHGSNVHRVRCTLFTRGTRCAAALFQVRERFAKIDALTNCALSHDMSPSKSDHVEYMALVGVH